MKRPNPLGICPRCGWLRPAMDYVRIEGELVPAAAARRRFRGLTAEPETPGVCPECHLDIARWEAERGTTVGRERALRRLEMPRRLWHWERRDGAFAPVARQTRARYWATFDAVFEGSLEAALFACLSEADTARLAEKPSDETVGLTWAWFIGPCDAPSLGALRRVHYIGRFEGQVVNAVDLHDEEHGPLDVLRDGGQLAALWIVPGGSSVTPVSQFWGVLEGWGAPGPGCKWVTTTAQQVFDDAAQPRWAYR